MTDILERLRDASYENAPSRCMEAAREIEQLRAALDEARSALAVSRPQSRTPEKRP